MKGLKGAASRCFSLGTDWALLLAAAAAGLLYWVFSQDRNESWPAYCIYGFSAYALCVLALWVFRTGKKGWALLLRNRWFVRWKSDREYRAVLSLYLGLAVNLLYAAFKLGMGLRYASGWFLAVAVYYAVLGVIRFLLLRGVKKAPAKEEAKARLRHELRTCRACGWLVLLLTLAMAGVAAIMTVQDQTTHYPGSIIYGAAAYAFYSLITAISSMAQSRRQMGPVLWTGRLLCLAGALLSVFFLQTALLAEFGAALGAARRQWNAATGAAVCLLVFGMAVYLIRHTTRCLQVLCAPAAPQI